MCSEIKTERLGKAERERMGISDICEGIFVAIFNAVSRYMQYLLTALNISTILPVKRLCEEANHGRMFSLKRRIAVSGSK